MKRISPDKAQLQMLAVVAMVLDHCTFLVNDVWLRGLFHLAGRITIIVMSFFVSEGYYKTGNVYKYIIRLGIFAVVSQVPFALFHYGRIPVGLYQIYDCFYNSRNVIFTLFISLILLVIISSDRNIIIKCIAFFAGLFITRNSDWSWGCILWVLGFARYYGNIKKQMLCAMAVILLKFVVKAICFVADAYNGGFSFVSLYYLLTQLGGFMAIPLLMCYNGEKGNMHGLGFYLFYPVHLAVLFIIDLFI